MAASYQAERWRNHWKQFGVQCFSKGHFKGSTRGVRDQATDFLISGQAALPLEPRHQGLLRVWLWLKHVRMCLRGLSFETKEVKSAKQELKWTVWDREWTKGPIYDELGVFWIINNIHLGICMICPVIPLWINTLLSLLKSDRYSQHLIVPAIQTSAD